MATDYNGGRCAQPQSCAESRGGHFLLFVPPPAGERTESGCFLWCDERRGSSGGDGPREHGKPCLLWQTVTCARWPQAARRCVGQGALGAGDVRRQSNGTRHACRKSSDGGCAPSCRSVGTADATGGHVEAGRAAGEGAKATRSIDLVAGGRLHCAPRGTQQGTIRFVFCQREQGVRVDSTASPSLRQIHRNPPWRVTTDRAKARFRFYGGPVGPSRR